MKPYYADEAVTLYHGDCREITDWITANILVTDPPYGIRWKRGDTCKGRGWAADNHAGITNDEDTSVRDTALAMWGQKPALVFGSFYAPFPRAVKQVLVYAKGSNTGVVGSVTGWRRDAEPVFVLGEWPKRVARASSVLRTLGSGTAPTSGPRVTGHPHAKPGDVMASLIAGAPPGCIADPFAGGGSTLVAAKALGRSAIGVEIDERYCEVIAKRLAQGILDFGGVA